VKQAVEVLVLYFYCNCVCISLRDPSSSTLFAVLVTYLHSHLEQNVLSSVLMRSTQKCDYEIKHIVYDYIFLQYRKTKKCHLQPNKYLFNRRQYNK